MTLNMTIPNRVACPSCDKKGKQVSVSTLAALLKEEFSASFLESAHSCCDSQDEGCTSISEATGWWFCDSLDCDVVYFSEAGGAIFTKSQLRVSVGVKERTGERPLCYCFGHSVASIKEELRTNGSSAALNDIRAKMANPGCRCATENPSGSCCLGSVARGIEIAQEELGMSDVDTQPPLTPTKPPTSKPSTSKGEKIAKVGTIVSAIMASACCWLPLVLLAVGISGAGIAATLEAYRPLFIVVTFSFLGAAFYFTYRPKKAATASGHDCCAAIQADREDCCSSVGTRRFSMIGLNKVMLWVVTVVAVAFLFFPSYVGAFLGGDGKRVTESMNQAIVHVEGMTCEGCSVIVAKAIRSAPNVMAVEVDYEKGEALVGTEIGYPFPRDEILTALQEAGYRVTQDEGQGSNDCRNQKQFLLSRPFFRFP